MRPMKTPYSVFTRTLFFAALLVGCVSVPLHCAAITTEIDKVNPDASLTSLLHQGTQLRLSGDFAAAKEIETRLIERFDEPVGHIFALNSIVTLLTWDARVTLYDADLLSHASKALDWCESTIKSQPDNALGPYYCGQTHFALSFYHALRGNYYQAGRQGTLCIERLERALIINPKLVDAKMHLGVSYFVADNLPPFVKVFSKLLWFIPTGNSQKSLPYLLEVMQHGQHYQDVARYIYSTLLFDGDEAAKLEAMRNLQHLVKTYPQNVRFHLRLASLFLEQERFEEALETGNAYFALAGSPKNGSEVALLKTWMVRAYMGMHRIDEAETLFAEINPDSTTALPDLPNWSASWLLITNGQLHDLAQRRQEAVSSYRQILEIAGTEHVNELIVDAARLGIKTPFTIK